MKIAVVGAGISGLTAALLLHKDHEVTVFEADDHIGGHTNTIRVDLNGESQWVDTGFVVYNRVNYPNFLKILDRLGVQSQNTSMSFSVRCDRTGLEYNGSSVNRLFVQRRNLFRPSFHRMVRDILRFNREASASLDRLDDSMTLAEYVSMEGYSREFAENYLVPLGSAIWSCPAGRFREFPIRFVIEFMKHHYLLQVHGRPAWRVIRGGSRRYVEAMTRPFRQQILLRCSVRSVQRRTSCVRLSAGGAEGTFDHIIFACHSDQALDILEDASDLEREVLGNFPYQMNETILHTDTAVLPSRRRAWASWNYRIRGENTDQVAVTYDMNILQSLASKSEFCVTLNDNGTVAPGKIIRRMTYHHPVYATGRVKAQACHSELINSNRTSFCGAYWGYGFHEDGVKSALRVCSAFGKSL